MDFTRRGIFGLLGGALLAKLVGPRLIAEPTEALWQAAKVLPVRPVVNTYVPLEQICAEMLRFLNMQLEQLELRQLADEQLHTKIGTTCFVRYPAELELDWPTFPIPGPILPKRWEVTLGHSATVSMDVETLNRPDFTLEELRELFLRPAAGAIASKIVQRARTKKAKVLVTGGLPPRSDADRCVIARDDKAGLIIQANQYSQMPHKGDYEYGKPALRVSILYGLG